MSNKEAVKWLENLINDIGQTHHQDLWHYEQALSEIIELLESMREVKRMSDAISKASVCEILADIYPTDGEKVVAVKEIDKAYEAILHLSSADQEIIRCKDCKHYYYADNRIPQEQRYICELDGDRWKPDDYCSFAERRE